METSAVTTPEAITSYDSREVSVNEQQWVTFQMEGETYCYEVMSVREILHHTEVTPVPGGPSFVKGIINLRGEVVTVLSLRLLFELPEVEVTDNSRIVVVEGSGGVCGLLVDSVSDVVTVDPDKIDSASSGVDDANQRYIRGVSQHEVSGMLVLLSLDSLFESVSERLH